MSTIAEHPIQTIDELRELLRSHLRAPDRLQKPEGLPTGCLELDQFLFWGGFPKGALSFLSGDLGTGATSLWLDCAANVLQSERWVSWVNSKVHLSPLPLYTRKLPLKRFIAIDAATTDEKLFQLLQELMSASLFELIGCDLGERMLKDHQLRKLQAQARVSKTALVFLSQGAQLLHHRRRILRGTTAAIFSLILSFEKKHLVIERAQHRPTPHRLTRSVSYARFTQFLTDSGQELNTENSSTTSLGDNSKQHESYSLLETAEKSDGNGLQT